MAENRAISYVQISERKRDKRYDDNFQEKIR